MRLPKPLEGEKPNGILFILSDKICGQTIIMDMTLPMKITEFNGTRICVLADNDKLTQCPEGSYAVIEDSGFYVSLLVIGSEAWTIHPDLLPTLEDALDLIAERRGLFV
ncbi:hypothetical protein [Candidatus Symbiopectobacterium sp. NZEC127]|uniref:hypothetical protein n=1 Tax=Candidatus Symbiopectobacterium sp. NZEC127 TaxID=2820472 RepID=UPI0022269610|nr:hypothetical protein [Candidatus Symbiopectobacterium sp. NZEC127]